MYRNNFFLPVIFFGLERTPMARYKYMRLRIANMPDDIIAVPSRHYVGRMDWHIYGWSAHQCRTHLGYTREVKNIRRVSLDHYFSTSTRYRTSDMCESSATTDHSLLTHRISPTILIWRCQPSGIGDNREHPAGVNLKRYCCILNT